MKHITLFFAILIVLCSCSTPEHVEVQFLDPNLAAAVREVLKLDENTPIKEKDLEKIKSLNASNCQISNLTGLGKMTGLTELFLTENQIVDITPLKGLDQLTNLNLRNNKISDISPIVGLTNLTHLTLSGNHIKDIQPLSNLTQLTDLILSFNDINNIIPLKGLTELESLMLPITQSAILQLSQI